MAPAIVTLDVGERFGRLCVIGKTFKLRSPAGYNKGAVVVKCDCGEHAVVFVNDLKRSRVRSCGCLRREVSRASGPRNTVHGGRGTRLYVNFGSMIARCHNPKHQHWRHYGGRGITVCPEWRDFKVFREWAVTHGYKEGLTIDRIDPTKGYCPENCQWITRRENSKKVWTDMAARTAALEARIAALEASNVAILHVLAVVIAVNTVR